MKKADICYKINKIQSAFIISRKISLNCHIIF